MARAEAADRRGTCHRVAEAYAVQESGEGDYGMSHVDEALRAWEEATGLRRAEVEVYRSDPRGALNTYTLEDGSRPLLPELVAPPQPAAASRAQPFTPIARTTPSPAVGDVDFRSRLVSGTLDAVGVEQYRRLAASLDEAQASAGLKSVMVTSALPHEGKTLTTVNLALTLSEAFARRVLLVDGDLRWPSVHTYFGIANVDGLSEALTDEHSPPALHSVSDRLSVLTSGQPGPTPLAGLSSPRMGALLGQWVDRFDWVLIDTPPVGLLPDAQLVARLAGAVLLVVGAGSAPSAAVERVVAELGPDSIIGTVLNRVERHRITNSTLYERYDGRRQ